MPLVMHDGMTMIGPEFQAGDSAWTNTFGDDCACYEHVTIAYYIGSPAPDISGFFFFVIPYDPDFVFTSEEFNEKTVLGNDRFTRLQSHQLISEAEFVKLQKALAAY